MRERGEFPVKVRVRGGYQTYVVDYHPFDVVGWDGYLFPWTFSIHDFEPITGRIHQPPPSHQTFAGRNFVICSFCPRKLDFDPLAVPIPYHHSNLQSEEMIYYVSGNFGSRRGVEVGSITLHPVGPAARAAARAGGGGARDPRDVRAGRDVRHLQSARSSRASRSELDDGVYWRSWYDNAQAPADEAADATGAGLTSHFYAVTGFGALADRRARVVRRGRGRRPRRARRRVRGADAEPAARARAARVGRGDRRRARHDGPRTSVGEARLRLPFDVADYVDFYSSLEHATNLGRMFRPGQEPLLPNWRWLPVGYHGRAGTVVVSGTDVVRPHGQRVRREPTSARRRGSTSSSSSASSSACPAREIPVEAFADHVFGVVLVNDWSARDIQAWEYVPLGPFLGKSFQTSISAWVTPLALLEPRRVEAPPQEPPPLPHLAGGRDWALDLDLELELNGEVVSRGNARTLYWTMPQQLAHATSNGATVRTGDLMATGAISGSGARVGGIAARALGGRALPRRRRRGRPPRPRRRGRARRGSRPASVRRETRNVMSFDHHDPKFVEDPESVIGPIREEHPLVHSDLYGGFWLLTRYDDVTRAALDHESFTSAVVGTTDHPAVAAADDPLLPIELDPPEHTLYRGLVNALFSKPRIEALRPELEALATRLLEPIARERRRRRRGRSSRTRCRSARSRAS